jgi:hypothetical protein
MKYKILFYNSMTDKFLKTANITDNINYLDKNAEKDDATLENSTPFEVKMVLSMTFVAGMAYWQLAPVFPEFLKDREMH